MGSWDPDNPSKDAWGTPGGRHMVTCLSCLTLEVYYRYLPLYKVDAEGGGGAAVPAPVPAQAEKPPAGAKDAKAPAKGK